MDKICKVSKYAFLVFTFLYVILALLMFVGAWFEGNMVSLSAFMVLFSGYAVISIVNELIMIKIISNEIIKVKIRESKEILFEESKSSDVDTDKKEDENKSLDEDKEKEESK